MVRSPSPQPSPQGEGATMPRLLVEGTLILLGLAYVLPLLDCRKEPCVRALGNRLNKSRNRKISCPVFRRFGCCGFLCTDAIFGAFEEALDVGLVFIDG